MNGFLDIISQIHEVGFAMFHNPLAIAMGINPSWCFTFIHTFILFSLQTNLAFKCIEREKQALLSFKSDLLDKHNILSSWRSKDDTDCCNWTGVHCNNNTSHHIITLKLRGSHNYYLEGKMGSSLVHLSHLLHLDLSYNFFEQSPLLDNIGSLVNLQYLNLSYNRLTGVIPPQLGNLSKLSTLDLQQNYFLNDAHDSFQWVSGLSSLKQLHLGGLSFGRANDWVIVISKLTLLESLSLQICDLPQPILLSHSSTNFSRFLSKLDLHGNRVTASIFPWLLNFHNSLAYLDLSFNDLQGLTIDDFGNMTSLVFLELSSAQVDFHSPKPFENLCNLKSLSLSHNNFGGLLSDFLNNFPRCVHNSLQYLKLASNELLGFLPNFTKFPSLKGLDLSKNRLKGTIPQSFGQLSNLEYLYLDQNSLEGEVLEAHLSNLSNLQGLDLSGNPLSLNFKPNWVPPFQLDSIFLRSCKLGPIFPKWLQTQNFSFLDISNAGISDIVPHWFWKNLSPKLEVMDLSGNKMKGEIPNFSVKFKETPIIILKSNQLVGQIPTSLLQAASLLDLSKNKLSGLTYFCEITNSPLLFLDLSNNQFSGQLPDCWDQMSNLAALSLTNNTFSGEIPSSIGSLNRLIYFHLRSNQFSGHLSSWFNFTDLVVFDAMDNNFSGPIPPWIGSEFPNLVRLNLKSNHFHGNLPSSLCNLKDLQVLDVSSNNITGSIPTCIYSFNALTQRSSTSEDYSVQHLFGFQPWTLFYVGFSVTYNEDMAMVWKGQVKFITGDVLQLERSIDLSCNHLVGRIPSGITELVGLVTLNLSHNNLTGQIPEKMGQMYSLESLDLSRNHLVGSIPFSFSQMSMLSTLNLSYNNLSGKVPFGTQLQGFAASSYEGNSYLCGVPLKMCFEDQDIPNVSLTTTHVEDENGGGLVIEELFISIFVGFVVGFGGLFGSLILYRKWRYLYFEFLSDIIEKVRGRRLK